ncbi:hypothetical protein Y1Q_0014530 [Alligator mississippiensis]|uniref:Uncharacterized protein n=1 Tax=Alligator mississippiensis TaxID=8496 RepID=A0A151PD17_ALLMI|nr:hypothetical protein Y1Q_0014530 [Alligator mississippiensis]
MEFFRVILPERPHSLLRSLLDCKGHSHIKSHIRAEGNWSNGLRIQHEQRDLYWTGKREHTLFPNSPMEIAWGRSIDDFVDPSVSGPKTIFASIHLPGPFCLRRGTETHWPEFFAGVSAKSF